MVGQEGDRHGTLWDIKTFLSALDVMGARATHHAKTQTRVERSGLAEKFMSRLASVVDHKVVELSATDKVKPALIKKDGKKGIRKVAAKAITSDQEQHNDVLTMWDRSVVIT